MNNITPIPPLTDFARAMIDGKDGNAPDKLLARLEAIEAQMKTRQGAPASKDEEHSSALTEKRRLAVESAKGIVRSVDVFHSTL